MELVTGMGSSISYKNIASYLGIDNKKISPRQQELIFEISNFLTAKGIDAETSVSIFQSFENKISQRELIDDRLSSFNKFITSIKSKDDLIESIKDFGLMSKSELENKALETGNWLPFMKRVEKEKEKVSNDNKENALGSKADI